MSSQSNLTFSPETGKQNSGGGPSTEKPKRHWLVWVIVVVVLAAGGYYLSRSGVGSKTDTAAKGTGKKGGKGMGGPIPVSAEKVVQGDMGVYISDILGTVTPTYTVSITSRVAGQLMQVSYREGQMVHKGDVLAEIDPRPYEAALEQAQGQLQRDEALLKNARTDVTRYEAAFAQHAIPEQTLVTQQATVNQDEGTVKLDQGNVDAAKVNVEYTKLVSPIDGRVGLRQVDPGNIVPANGTAALLTITQLQPITVIFPMAEDHINEVVEEMHAGHRLTVLALDRSNSTQIAQGTLLTLDNQIDPGTGTVKVRAQFANSDLKLFPNEFVNARLLVKTIKGANIIPSAALQRSNDSSYVYVIDPESSTVMSRPVKILTSNGLQAAVTGVQAGETLVTDGFDKLQDKTKVVIRKPRAAQAAEAGSATDNSTNSHSGHKGHKQ
jgi:multidrug efflux system membrane fusion protein